MKRLLCIVGGMNAGGAETFLMKIYRALDKSRYQMDFCVSKQEKGFYDDEIISLGGKIIHTVPKSRNPFGSFASIYSIVRKGKYKYVMRVSQNSLSAMELVAAKAAGASVLVFRSSNSSTMKGGIEALLHKLFKFLPNLVATVKIAPSLPAARFMFGEKSIKNNEILFLKNGIPLDKYSFDAKSRNKIRAEIGIQDQLLIGHIGRFVKQKNHMQLLDIFREVLKQKRDAHLVFVGEGELEGLVKQKVHEYGLDDKVHFLGVRQDIPEILSAMDVFVFPSLYEGMPNTVIEAQANGLPCVISDKITSEVKLCDNISFVSLKENATWAKKIIEIKRIDSVINQEQLRQGGYSIEDVVHSFTSTVFDS